MEWLSKFSSLIRAGLSADDQPGEQIFLKSLIKDIRCRVKTIENQRRRLVKKEDKLRARAGGEDDITQKLAVYQKENKYLDEYVSILRLKLTLTETKLDEVVSKDEGE